MINELFGFLKFHLRDSEIIKYISFLHMRVKYIYDIYSL